MQLDVHIRLERQQVGHAQNARVHGCRMLDFKGAHDRASPKPQDVNLFHRSQRCIIVIERKAFEQGVLFVLPLLQDCCTISAGNPNGHAHARPNACDERLNPY